MALGCTLLASLARACPQDTIERDTSALLEGVSEITAPGIPGALTVFGKSAFPLVLGEYAGARAPVVAAARVGNARLVAFSHDGYGSEAAAKEADTGKLLLNCVRFAAGSKAKAVQGPRVLVFSSGLTAWLNSQGLRAIGATGALASHKLSDFDVVLVGGPGLSPADLEALDKYLKSSGGVLGMQTAWGWAQHAGGATIRENRLHQLFAPYGLSWTTATTGKTSERGYRVGESPAPHVHAARALDALEKQPDLRSLQAEVSIDLALSVLDKSDTQWWPRVESLLTTHAARLKTPITKEASLLRLLARVQPQIEAQRKALEVRAHECAADFPGRVPEKAPRITRRLQLAAQVPGWASTGLYCDAGQAITIDIPKDALTRGLYARIGAHSDTLFHLDRWERMPEISRRYRLDQTTTQIASAFGGLLYIEVPAGLLPGEISVLVRNAVEAPLYVHGKTSLEEWRQEQRLKPAPWAELASSKVVLSVPSEFVRTLDDPTQLMAFWDQCLDAMADLAGIPHERVRPERIVADRQISAGYMHAGYPIMTHLDAAPRMVDLPTLQRGDWGLLHELGHNHQREEWTFDCTGEVTNNVFVLYVLETVCHQPLEAGHQGVSEGASKLQRHLEAGATWESFCNDPFLALHMYRQLVGLLGWEKFRAVIASYHQDSAEQRPKTQEERRDQWMLRCARAAGQDLSRFFRSWGIPVSDAACTAISTLPEWMPADWPE